MSQKAIHFNFDRNFGKCRQIYKICCNVAVVFAATGIIQWPITSCSRRDHLICQASANIIRKI